MKFETVENSYNAHAEIDATVPKFGGIRNQDLRGPKVISERWLIFAKRSQSDTQRLHL
jgi:hypothetical protein